MAQTLARPYMRALASALTTGSYNLIGMGLGPLVVGLVSDRLEPAFGVEALRYGLLVVMVTHLGGAALNFRAARHLRADLGLPCGSRSAAQRCSGTTSQSCTRRADDWTEFMTSHRIPTMKRIAAAKFKEQCLALLDRVGPEGIVITKHGRPVAKLVPVETDSKGLIGALRGKLTIRGPILSTGQRWNAES